MCTSDTLPKEAHSCVADPKPRWGISGWLHGLALFWRLNELDALDDHLRSDIGLPRRMDRPDAAALLDMSRPGRRRW